MRPVLLLDGAPAGQAGCDAADFPDFAMRACTTDPCHVRRVAGIQPPEAAKRRLGAASCHDAGQRNYWKRKRPRLRGPCPTGLREREFGSVAEGVLRDASVLLLPGRCGRR